MKKYLIRSREPAANGFTLAEILVAVVIIGIAIAALVGANGAFTQVNGAAVDLSTAEFLIEEIRELTTMSAYDDLYDFDNASFCPPVDVAGIDLTDFSSFTQQVTVENVNSSSLETPVADHTTDFIRITVAILQNNRPVSSASWIRASY
jgi:prepilin-type N-terminal cleavage/methylation domain-containing protein